MKLEPGVYGRYFESGARSIRIHFTFRGVRCQETLKGLDPERRNHVKVAKNRLSTVQDAMDRGTFNYLEHFPDSKRARIFGFVVSTRTVKQVAESWLADMKMSLPHSTYRSYAGPCKSFIFPAIGELRIRDVTVEHIRRMFRDANVSLKTARNYSIPLRAIFDRALDDDDIDRSPMERINVKTLIPRSKHRTDYEPDPLSEVEIFRFLSACSEFRPRWFNYWTVAFYSGLRTSELYGLQWSDIDWRERTIRVQRAIVERQGKGPKTESSIRDVYLVDVVLDALKEQRAATELVGAEIFRNPTTGKTLDDYEISQRAFDFCLRKAGVRRRNQYQTRHTYASNALSAGENPAFVAKQLGHHGLNMLFRVYAKWISNDVASRTGFGKRSKALLN